MIGSWPAERLRAFLHKFLEYIQIYPQPLPGGRMVKRIRFKFPVSVDGGVTYSEVVDMDDEGDGTPPDTDPPSGGGGPQDHPTDDGDFRLDDILPLDDGSFMGSEVLPNPNTLSVLLGHASVSFTMDTYAHVLTDYKKESMALMEDLYSMGQTPLQEVSYAVIVTSQPDGTMMFNVPDFPEVKYSGVDMPQGLQYIKERLQEEKLISIFPPSPTPPNQLVLEPGQMILQLPI